MDSPALAAQDFQASFVKPMSTIVFLVLARMEVRVTMQSMDIHVLALDHSLVLSTVMVALQMQIAILHSFVAPQTSVSSNLLMVCLALQITNVLEGSVKMDSAVDRNAIPHAKPVLRATVSQCLPFLILPQLTRARVIYAMVPLINAQINATRPMLVPLVTSASRVFVCKKLAYPLLAKMVDPARPLSRQDLCAPACLDSLASLAKPTLMNA